MGITFSISTALLLNRNNKIKLEKNKQKTKKKEPKKIPIDNNLENTENQSNLPINIK
tara:strand:- start:131 stop:301 length:171 start_codon:yes stop_codon:yes gene_type:complete